MLRIILVLLILRDAAEFEAGKCSGGCPKVLLHAIHTYLDAGVLAYISTQLVEQLKIILLLTV